MTGAWTEEPGERAPRARALGGLLVTLLASALVLAAGLAPLLGLAASGAVAVSGYWNALPTSLDLDAPLQQRTRLLDRHGRQFAELFDTDRVVLPLTQISPTVVTALVATEDSRFYQHHGVDLRGTLRALVHDTSGSQGLQGGSTITQQLVKNIRQANGDPDGTPGHASVKDKIQDARYAMALEHELPKDQILDRYLNTVFFGAGSYGIGSAARRYFNTTAALLTVSQAATLVGLVQSPVAYDPIAHPDTDPVADPSPAHLRRNIVLQRMVAFGKLAPDEATALEAEPVRTTPFVQRNGCAASTYPFYCEHVREEILSDPAFGPTPEDRAETLARGGLTITTALDPAVQEADTAAATAAMPVTDRIATALATVEPGSGLITAIAENRNWGTLAARGQTEIVYADQKAFQPGSSFKPFTLATALELGLDPHQKLPAPAVLKTVNTDYPTSPPPPGFHNDDGADHGRIDAYAATGGSVNTWYVGLIDRIGVLHVADLAARLGITSIPRTGARALTGREASLTLGTYEVSPLEMAAAYASFASGGVTCAPVAITAVVDTPSGTSLPAPDAHCHRTLTRYVADTVTDVLHAPLGKGGTAAGLGLPGRDSVGKTGTTTNAGATWFVGFTPQLATSVWVGDPLHTTRALDFVEAYGQVFTSVFGATIAAPIWHAAMTTALTGVPASPFERPVPGALTVAVPAVPAVTGLTEQAARQVLETDGYTVEAAPAGSDPLARPGVVVSQLPPAGAGQSRGTVRITVTGRS